MQELTIRPFENSYENALIALWEKTGLTRPWNPPKRDIKEKQKIQPELFLVALHEGILIGSVMAAYDGHRGSVNYLAIDPEFQGKGIARKLMFEVETKLKAMGCPKVNLMIRSENEEVQAFYDQMGYEPQEVVVVGKWLD